jgi:glycosyltransferase involved in cell wall biosynthesis
MKILFISRAYPPVIGGIEQQNFDLASALSDISDVSILANTRGKLFLPLFLPYVTLRALLSARKYDVVLLGDGVLGITGYVLRRFTGTAVACIIHGLDLTYKNTLYQKLWVNKFIPQSNKLIAVGNETIHQGVMRGLPESKFVFIPNGVIPVATAEKFTHQELEARVGKRISGPILLTLGRLVKRKGISWFIENVVNMLDSNVVYIVAGAGKEETDILAAIQRNRLQERVLFIGNVSDRDKQLLLSSADIFIQPNIRVAGDMEGFGLVVLEAAARGCVVIASRLEGLTDAIQHGLNGYLVSPGNAAEYKERIEAVLDNPQATDAFGQQARDYVDTHYAWSLIARKYLDVLASLVPAA